MVLRFNFLGQFSDSLSLVVEEHIPKTVLLNLLMCAEMQAGLDLPTSLWSNYLWDDSFL